MKLTTLCLIGIIFTGCATRAEQTDRILQGKTDFPKVHLIDEVPFIEQRTNHCGPASLAMILHHKGHAADVNELAFQMMTPLMEGTFQTDLITSVRRQGMLAIPVNDLRSLLKEISKGNPAVVFQNLGLKDMPQWHYAVATGYKIEEPLIYLHSGKEAKKEMDMRLFEHTWSLADYWGIIVLRPGETSTTADDLTHVAATAGLEQLNKFEEAEKSYFAILQKWPDSLGAHIGLGNIRYSQGRYSEAVIFLKAATIKHPNSSMAWHNLAVAQGAAGMFKDAGESSEMALSLADIETRSSYHRNLQEWLSFQ